MQKIRQKRYIHLPDGEMRELCPGVPIKGAKVIPADPKIIAKMDAESIRKSEIQRQNDLEAMLWAKTHGCCWYLGGIYMKDSNINRYLPKELLKASNVMKPIEPPKGRISSKAAYVLQSQISIQTEANNAAVRKQFEHMLVEGKF